jgi:hypothetical protein
MCFGLTLTRHISNFFFSILALGLVLIKGAPAPKFVNAPMELKGRRMICVDEILQNLKFFKQLCIWSS